MSEGSETRTFYCDAIGCRAFCQISGAVLAEDVGESLAARGWSSRGRHHLCPVHTGEWDRIPTPTETLTETLTETPTETPHGNPRGNPAGRGACGRVTARRPAAPGA